MKGRDISLKTLAALGIIQSALRLYYYYQAVFLYRYLFYTSVPPGSLTLVNDFSLGLGLGGLIAMGGLVLRTRWGYLGAIAVCITSIFFDAWAVLYVQQDAWWGIVVPLAILVYVVPRRSLLIPER